MATTAAEPSRLHEDALFVDTNVLIYANVVESPFHEVALGALRQARAAGLALWISRQVLREYLVALTRPSAWSIGSPSWRSLSGNLCSGHRMRKRSIHAEEKDDVGG